MKLEDIHSEWANDCEINQLNLSGELRNIGPLHAKYWRYLSEEKIRLEKYNSQYKQLYEDKFWFFMNGEDEETRAKGWILPLRGVTIIKDEAKRLVEKDQDIIELSLKRSICNTKIDLLESILKSIQGRSFIISNVIKWTMFQNGSL